jgi:hypothetical protein
LKVGCANPVVFSHLHDALGRIVVGFLASPLRVAPNNVWLLYALIKISFQDTYFSSEPFLSITETTDLFFKFAL